MHSWVFRKRLGLEAIYLRQPSGHAPRIPEPAAALPTLREGLRVHLLVPEPPRNLRAAGG